MTDIIMNVPQKQSNRNAVAQYFANEGPIGPPGDAGNTGFNSCETRTTALTTQSIALNNQALSSKLLWTLPTSPYNGKVFTKIIVNLQTGLNNTFTSGGYNKFFGYFQIWDSLGQLRQATRPIDLQIATDKSAVTGVDTAFCFQTENLAYQFGLGFTYQIFFVIFSTGGALQTCNINYKASVSVLLL